MVRVRKPSGVGNIKDGNPGNGHFYGDSMAFENYTDSELERAYAVDPDNVTVLREAAKRFSERLAPLTAERDELLDQNDSLRREITDLEEMVVDLEDDRDERAQEIADLQHEIDDMEARAADTEEALTALERQVAALRGAEAK